MPQKDHRVLSFPSFRHFVSDRANTSSVRRSGGKVLLSTIRQPFYPGRRRLGNLKAPTEKANLSKGNCEFHKTRLFLQLVIFSSVLINLIYFGFS